MSYELEVAGRYRRRAEELRKIADEDGLGETRRMLLQVAKEYDGMAENMEAIARHREPLGRASPRSLRSGRPNGP